MSDFVNYLIAAALCAFLFTDLRFDFDYASTPTLIALLVFTYIALNYGS